MKIIILIFLLLPIFSFSQKDSTSRKENQVAYYLDSTQVDFRNFYLSPETIRQIQVIKEGEGKIYISLKKNAEINALTNLKNQHLDTIKNKIFLVDDKLIKCPSQVKIDLKEIESIEIVNSSELENPIAAFSIIKIKTFSAQKEQKKKIIIKG